MKESLSKRELRELTLWGAEESEELSDGFLRQVKELLPGWEPKELSNEVLEEMISIPAPDLPGEFVDEITKIVGKENIDFSAKSRVLYSHGGSSEDLLRIRTGNFSKLTEAVVHPQSEGQIIAILQACEKHNIALIPVGGRTSVTRALSLTRKGIALDLHPHMVKITRIDETNRTVTTQAGIFGPVLEAALNEKGFTFGHFPQSYEQCSVGGWIAARSAGQNSTLYGKIEDMVLSMRIITSKGVFESPKVPACATGPHWLPYFIGSEGTLGIITQATLKIHLEPEKREFASYMFPSFDLGVNCLRKICQSGFLPSIARLSDGTETQVYILLSREGKTTLKDKIINKILDFKKLVPYERSILLLVFEGTSDHVKMAKKVAKKAAKGNKAFSSGGSFAKLWYKDRFEHPHLRDKLIDHGVIIDTLETISTWDNIVKLRDGVNNDLQAEAPIIMAHCSHSYPEGSAIYFVYFSPIKHGNEVDQCRNMQKLTLDAFFANGGVTTHHHGVGKAFIPWAKREWGPQMIEMAKGVKEKLDPKGILNPGNFPFDE